MPSWWLSLKFWNPPIFSNHGDTATCRPYQQSMMEVPFFNAMGRQISWKIHYKPLLYFRHNCCSILHSLHEFEPNPVQEHCLVGLQEIRMIFTFSTAQEKGMNKISSFQFQLCRQRAPFKRQHTFTMHSHFVKKSTFRFSKGGLDVQCWSNVSHI